MVIVKIVRISVVAAALVVCAAVSQASDSFYTTLLTRGIADAQRGDHYKAAKELRIAAFGTVDDPALYLRAQVYLANALENLGRHADAAAAVEKASLAERLMPVYATAAIDPDTRSAFEALAVKSLRPEQLAFVPAFTRKAAQAPPAPVPSPVQQQQPTPVVTAPKPVPPPVQVVQQQPKPALQPAPKPVSQPAPKPVQPQPQPESPLVAASRRQPSQSAMAIDAASQMNDAQRLLNEGKILAARQIYVRLSNVEGLSRATLLDVAQGLNQTSTWRDSSVVYRKLMPFRAGEEMHEFYEAVNHYELGDMTGARNLLNHVLPSLPVTRETSLYRSKILGMQ